MFDLLPVLAAKMTFVVMTFVVMTFVQSCSEFTSQQSWRVFIFQNSSWKIIKNILFQNIENCIYFPYTFSHIEKFEKTARDFVGN